MIISLTMCQINFIVGFIWLKQWTLNIYTHSLWSVVSGAQSSADSFFYIRRHIFRQETCKIQLFWFFPKWSGKGRRESLRTFVSVHLEICKGQWWKVNYVSMFLKSGGGGDFYIIWLFYYMYLYYFVGSGGCYFFPDMLETQKLLHSGFYFPLGGKIALCHRSLSTWHFPHFLIGSTAPSPFSSPLP